MAVELRVGSISVMFCPRTHNDSLYVITTHAWTQITNSAAGSPLPITRVYGEDPKWTWPNATNIRWSGSREPKKRRTEVHPTSVSDSAMRRSVFFCRRTMTRLGAQKRALPRARPSNLRQVFSSAFGKVQPNPRRVLNVLMAFISIVLGKPRLAPISYDYSTNHARAPERYN